MIFTIVWVTWLLVFLGIEAVALIRKERGDTLSEHVWLWFNLRKSGKTTWQKVRRYGFLAFWLWLTIHFVSGGAFL